MEEQSKSGSNKFLILSLIIGLLMIGGAVGYAKLSATGSTQMFSEKIDVPPQMTDCSGDQNCIIVETRCDFCCEFVAINSAFEAQFDKIFARNCSLYTGEKCSCSDLSRYPACVQGKCAMVKWPTIKQSGKQ